MIHLFISHASVDKPLVEAFTTALTESQLIARDRYFCTSIDGFSIRGGENCLTEIKKNLRKATLAIPFITPAYLDSNFCTWELGAIWAMGKSRIPLLFEPLTPGALPEIVRHDQVLFLDKEALEQIKAKIMELSGATVHVPAWEAKRDALLVSLPTVLTKLRPTWVTTTLAQQRLQARVGSSVDHLARVMEAIRDIGWAAIVIGDEPAGSTLVKAHLERLAKEISALFRATTNGQVRVSIKTVFTDTRPDGDQLAVEDLVRDKAQARHAGRDLVTDNTDFNTIIFDKEPYFRSGCLSALQAAGKYSNSHWP